MNNKLYNAKKSKNDEFYTLYEDIEKELENYITELKDKIIYCNCDNENSNFVKYFKNNKNKIGYKKLLYSGIGCGGKFEDNIELLKECDIVITNPPFSLFRQFVNLLYKYDKKFIIIGNMNAITYKEIFKLIKDNKLWVGTGFNLSMIYKSPYDNTLLSNKKYVETKGYNSKNYIKVPAINWYTNLEHKKRNEDIILYKTYKGNESDYPKYDNYKAINIDKVKDIPLDYEKIMGVPITFLGKYNPKQFEIIGNMATTKVDNYNFGYPYINKKRKYARILIKNKKVKK